MRETTQSKVKRLLALVRQVNSIAADLAIDVNVSPGNLNASRSPEIIAIQGWVADAFGVHPSEIIERGNDSRQVEARHVSMALCRELTPYSFSRIATGFKRLDHATVIHAIASIKGRCATERTFSESYAKLRASVTEKLQHAFTKAAA